jgi:archaellum biogenesis protein FlaJ (TadC family)
MLGVVLAVIFSFIFIAMEDWNESLAHILIAAFIVLLGVLFFVFFLTHRKKPDVRKKLEMENKEERNAAIRGKACEVMVFVSQIALIAVFCVCMILDYMLPALLVLLTVIASFASMGIASVYFNKKM